MDWVAIASAVGISGLLTTLVTAWLKRKIDNADYAQRILDQAEARVQQALADKARYLAERDDAYREAKEQRKAKQEWRTKYYEEAFAHQETKQKLSEALWNRCVKNCIDRTPPREQE